MLFPLPLYDNPYLSPSLKVSISIFFFFPIFIVFFCPNLLFHSLRSFTFEISHSIYDKKVSKCYLITKNALVVAICIVFFFFLIVSLAFSFFFLFDYHELLDFFIYLLC
jgi:hypothetical protein